MQSKFIKVNLPADYKYCNILDTCVATMLEQAKNISESEALIYDVQLAAQEVYTNVVRHAYAKCPNGRVTASLALKQSPRCLVIEFQDTGRSFNPAEIPEPNLRALQEGGFGLYLIRKLMDEVNYCSKPGNNRWRLVKYL